MRILIVLVIALLGECVTSKERYLSDMHQSPLSQPTSCRDAQSYLHVCNSRNKLLIRLREPAVDCYQASGIGALCQKGEMVFLSGGSGGYAVRVCDYNKQFVVDALRDEITCVKR